MRARQSLVIIRERNPRRIFIHWVERFAFVLLQLAGIFFLPVVLFFAHEIVLGYFLPVYYPYAIGYSRPLVIFLYSYGIVSFGVFVFLAEIIFLLHWNMKKSIRRVLLVMYVAELFAFYVWYYGFFMTKYTVPIKFRDNVSYTVVDNPQGFEAIYKNILVKSEIGGEYDYDIVGWQDEKTLVYEKDQRRFRYAYDMQTGKSILSKGEAPVFAKTCVYKDCIAPLVSIRYFGHDADGYLSPDGRYVAYTSFHLYGPQYLVIIGQEN